MPDKFIPNKSELFNGNKKYYVRMPIAIMQNPELTALEKLVWSRLAFYAGDKGRAFPHQETLAKDTGSTIRGLQKTLNGLREKGFIDWKIKNRRKSEGSEYVFLWHKSFDDISDELCSYKKERLNELCSESNELCSESNELCSESNELCSSGSKDFNCEETSQKPDSGRTPQTENNYENNYENKKENNNTGAGGCVETNNFNNSLTDQQREYIELKGEEMVALGKLTSTLGAFKNALLKAAKAGELDMSDYELLKMKKNAGDWNLKIPAAVKSIDDFKRQKKEKEQEELKQQQEQERRKKEAEKKKAERQELLEQIKWEIQDRKKKGDSEQEISDNITFKNASSDLNGEINSVLKEFLPADCVELSSQKKFCVDRIKVYQQGGTPLHAKRLRKHIIKLRELDPALAKEYEKKVVA